MSFYYLEIIKGEGSGKKFFLPDGAFSIGRNPRNTIVLSSSEKSISGHHCIIYKSPDRLMIQDFQSTNGTFINDRKILEKELVVGDEIGLGKNGPRLKLISSDVKFDEEPSSPGKLKEYKSEIKTTEINPIKPDYSSSEIKQEPAVKKLSIHQKSTPFHFSSTLEYERRLEQNDINTDVFVKLLKDDKRVEKIIRKGNPGSTLINVLSAVYKANKKLKRKVTFVIVTVVLGCAAICTYFAVKSFHYKQLFSKAQSLRNDLDEYDKKIATFNKSSGMDKNQLGVLIGEFDEKQKEFYSLKSQLDTVDFDKFYSDPIEKRIDGILIRYGESDYHIPKEMVERVKYHIDDYSGNLHAIISEYIKRKEKYFPLIRRIFEEKNLPADLAYVPMLESGYNPLALSVAGARGMWQFIKTTGEKYGLTINDRIDDRTDPEKSTYAAAEYFKELIGIFGGKSSVMLCMAAYNAGEGKVMNALRKIDDPIHNRDFWYIYRMGFLTEETNEYIPRLIALMIISEHPEEFGF